MRFRLRMRACFVAAESVEDMGLDSFIGCQPSSENAMSTLVILHVGLGFLRPLIDATKDFLMEGGV